MPEGDTILRAANRIRPVLEGTVPDEILAPQARHARDRWPERLRGRAVTQVDTHGKHLFLRFEGDLVLHSHLRMTGAWAVHPHGARWRRAPRRACLVLDVRPRMLAAAKRDVPGRDEHRVYDRAGRPCPRCGTRVEARGQGDDNRTTFWCPGCQR